MRNNNEPQNDETKETAHASSEDSEQPLRCPAPISVFPPERGGRGGDTLGIRQPKQSLSPGNRQAHLTPGWDLRSQLENLKEITSKFEGPSRGFWTQHFVTWGGNQTPIFQNCLIPWGNPASRHPTLGEK